MSVSISTQPHSHADRDVVVAIDGDTGADDWISHGPSAHPRCRDAGIECIVWGGAPPSPRLEAIGGPRPASPEPIDHVPTTGWTQTFPPNSRSRITARNTPADPAAAAFGVLWSLTGDEESLRQLVPIIRGNHNVDARGGP